MLPHLNRTPLWKLTVRLLNSSQSNQGNLQTGHGVSNSKFLETDGQYPKKICFLVWSDKIDELAIKQGENLVVSVDIESREFNGRWYTDVKAWQVTRAGAEADDIPFAEPEDFNNIQTEEPPLLDDEIPF